MLMLKVYFVAPFATNDTLKECNKMFIVLLEKGIELFAYLHLVTLSKICIRKG